MPNTSCDNLCSRCNPYTDKIVAWAILILGIVTSGIFSLIDIHTNCETYLETNWHYNATDEQHKCDGVEPMLLSRAFTTVGWARGIAIGFSVFGGFSLGTS